MGIRIGTLRPPQGATKDRKRRGQGMGTGIGKTAARGHKGQRSRSGGRLRAGFEGGQMPLQRRLPKRGFTNIFKKHFAIVNLVDLEAFGPDEKITPELLAGQGVIKKLGDGLRVLGNGELKAPLKIWAHHFSKTALEKIQKAGGTAEVIQA